MWLTSACLGLGHHNSCSMRRPCANRIVASTGNGAIEKNGIMQPFRFSALLYNNARRLIGFGSQIVEVP